MSCFTVNLRKETPLPSSYCVVTATVLSVILRCNFDNARCYAENNTNTFIFLFLFYFSYLVNIFCLLNTFNILNRFTLRFTYALSSKRLM